MPSTLRTGDEAFRTEAATQERAADLDVLGRNAEQFGNACLRHRQALARRIDGQRVAIPCRDDRVRLHRIVILRRCLVGRVDANGRRREACRNIAVLHRGGSADAYRGWHEALVGIQSNPCRSGFVAGRQQRGTFRRGLQRPGDHHRDWLVGVTHPVVLQQVEPEHERVQLRVRIQRQLRLVVGRHDLDHARMRLRSREVQEGDPATRNASHRQSGVKHAGRVMVGRVARAARDLQDAVTAGHRLADIGAVPLMSRSRGKRDIRHA